MCTQGLARLYAKIRLFTGADDPFPHSIFSVMVEKNYEICSLRSSKCGATADTSTKYVCKYSRMHTMHFVYTLWIYALAMYLGCHAFNACNSPDHRKLQWH